MSDTATRAAPAPAGGMQRIPFPLESYEHPSLPLVAKRLVNMMAEKAPDDARVAAALVSTPGLVPYISVGPGPILAMNDDQPGCIYVVSGVLAYRVSFAPDGSPTIEGIGNVGVPDAGTSPWNSFVTIAAGPTAVVICSAPHAYTCGHLPGDTLNLITDPDYPGPRCLLRGWLFRILGAGRYRAVVHLQAAGPVKFQCAGFRVLRRAAQHHPPGDQPPRADLDRAVKAGFEVWYDAGSSGLETMPGDVVLSVPPRLWWRDLDRHRLTHVGLPR